MNVAQQEQQQQQPQARLAQSQILPARTPNQRRAQNVLLVGFAMAAGMVIFLGVFLGNDTTSDDNNDNETRSSADYSASSNPPTNGNATTIVYEAVP